jgi:hypothetical protein
MRSETSGRNGWPNSVSNQHDNITTTVERHNKAFWDPEIMEILNNRTQDCRMSVRYMLTCQFFFFFFFRLALDLLLQADKLKCFSHNLSHGTHLLLCWRFIVVISVICDEVFADFTLFETTIFKAIHSVLKVHFIEIVIHNLLGCQCQTVNQLWKVCFNVCVR